MNSEWWSIETQCISEYPCGSPVRLTKRLPLYYLDHSRNSIPEYAIVLSD
jgi:hypothetical protein